MTQSTVLILGARGRFGLAAAHAVLQSLDDLGLMSQPQVAVISELAAS